MVTQYVNSPDCNANIENIIEMDEAKNVATIKNVSLLLFDSRHKRQ